MDEYEKERGAKKELTYVQPVSGYPYGTPEDDEISLVDLWLVLVRRKWIILASLCFALPWELDMLG